MPKELNAEQKKEILSIKREDVNKFLIMDWFTAPDFITEPKYSPQDTFKLTAGEFFNDETITTTIGRYLVNKFVFPRRYLAKKRYINVPITKKVLGSIENEMGIMVFNGEIPEEEYIEYMNNAIWLFMGQAYLLNPSMNNTIVKPIPEIIELRDKLFEQYRDKLEEGDTATIDYIESTLVKKAEEYFKAHPSEAYDYYSSGVSNIGNVYKKTAIMIGAVKDPSTQKIKMVKSNFTEGLKKDEYSATSNLTIVGGYARAEGTKVSGYSNKKFLNVIGGMSLDEPGTDCGTEHTLSITIRDDNKNAFLNRYIVEFEGNTKKLILLDYKTMPKYIGKTVNMRSPMFCWGEKICSKCAGEHYYLMGVKNAGVHINALGGRLLNAGLKKFHDSSIKYQTINIGDFII